VEKTAYSRNNVATWKQRKLEKKYLCFISLLYFMSFLLRKAKALLLLESL
jgi:hypothetical protein